MSIDNTTLVQFIKYTMAGGLATLTHIIIFHLMGWKLFPVLQKNDHAVRFFKLSTRTVSNTNRARNSIVCNAIAFLFSNMVAYITNSLWVFPGGKHHFLIEILLFFAVSAVSTFLGTLLMSILIRRFGILTTFAFGANMFTAVIINFALRKFFIFSG